MSTATTTESAKKTTAPPPKKRRSRAKKAAPATNGEAEIVVVDTEAEVETDIQELPEKDVKTAVKEINKIISDCAETRVSSTWRVGKMLADLRERCPKGQYARICKERIVDANGKPKSRSWCTKAVSMYSALPTNEKMAVKIGLGRLDQLVRLPVETRTDWIKEGIAAEDDEGNDVQIPVHDLSVSELKDAVNQALEELGLTKKKTPAEEAVDALQALAKKAGAFLEDHGKALKRKFEPVQIETMEACLQTLKEFIEGFEVPEAKATKKGRKAN